MGVGEVSSTRLGWLGAHERFTAHPGTGLMRMGVRLYDPHLGRFVQQDPVEGGNANDYTYVADPIGEYDLDGEWCLTGKNPNGSCRSVSRGAGRAARGGARYVRNHAVDIATGAAAAAVTAGCLGVTAGVGSVACISAGAGIVYMGSASAHALTDKNKSARHILTAPLRPIGTGILCGATLGSGCASAAWRRGPKPGFPRWAF
ncbi:MAG: hypothetical protein M5U14_01460 [Acidimicrobiia bacterium]|nr:hypothetical protein [Acidimicrobiia bacterium]